MSTPVAPLELAEQRPTGQARRCRHIFTAGRQCGSPSLRQDPFCYYHHTARMHSPRVPRRPGADTGEDFDFPLPEDRDAVQRGIGEVLRRIAAGRMDSKRASLLLYGLALASNNLPRAITPPAPRPLYLLLNQSPKSSWMSNLEPSPQLSTTSSNPPRPAPRRAASSGSAKSPLPKRKAKRWTTSSAILSSGPPPGPPGSRATAPHWCTPTAHPIMNLHAKKIRPHPQIRMWPYLTPIRTTSSLLPNLNVPCTNQAWRANLQLGNSRLDP